MKFFLSKISSRRLRYFLPLIIFFIFLILYGLTAARNPINYADSDDLTLAAYSGGLAHPPGYPYFIILYSTLIKLFSNIDPSAVVNLLTAVIGSMSVAAFYLALSRIINLLVKTEHGTVFTASLIASLWFGSTWYIWLHSTVVEVFVFELGLMAIFLYSYISLFEEKKSRKLMVNSIVAVISAALVMHHHQLGIPLIIVTWFTGHYFIEIKDRSKNIRIVKSSVLLFVLLFAVYLIPIFQTAGYSWPLVRTISGVAAFFLRLSYSAGGSQIETLTNVWSFKIVWNSLATLMSYLMSEIGIAGAVLALMGLLILRIKDLKIFLWSVFLLIIYSLILVLYLKFPASDITSEVDYFWGTALRIRMYYGLIFIVYILIGFGLYFLFELMRKKLSKKHKIALFIVLIWVTSFRIWQRYQYLDISDANFSHIYARRILKSLPDNSILYVDGDVAFSLILQQEIYKIRSDVLINPIGFSVQQSRVKKELKSYTSFNIDIHTSTSMAEDISSLINKGYLVYVYNPDSELLNKLGVEGNPFYAIPYGYVIEISKETKPFSFDYDYGLSIQLIEREDAPFDWWVSGLRSHVGAIHSQLAYYYARAGITDNRNIHELIARQLITWEKSDDIISDTLNEGDRQFELYESYLGYVPLSYEQYVEEGENSYIHKEYESAAYFWERAVILDTSRPGARQKLMELYRTLNMQEEWQYHFDRLSAVL